MNLRLTFACAQPVSAPNGFHDSQVDPAATPPFSQSSDLRVELEIRK